MKLVVAIVQDQDAAGVIDALVQAEYPTTRINTSGGFLKRGNATVLIGVEDDQVADVMRIVRQTARPLGDDGGRPANVRPGTMFVLPVARFVRV